MGGAAVPDATARAGNPWLDALLWGTGWASPGPGTVVDVYIAGMDGAEAVDDGLGSHVTAQRPLAQEVAAIHAAMRALEAVCDLDFRMTGSPDGADVVWTLVNGFDSPNAYGWALPPGYAQVDGESRGLIALNYEYFGPKSGPDLLARGGFDFCTLIHELGHAVGLAHPHDHGGGSGRFPGVRDPYDLGAHRMNQGIWTMMSYNDGWVTAPDGQTPSRVYGYQAGPMAFDIAALQHIYGADRTAHAGADAYRLPDGNGRGTFYLCLWDAGGRDRIEGADDRPNLIDLRPATLKVGPGAGGFVSHADGIHGGFTIAHGAVIEDAWGGARDDHLRGNGVRNALVGLDGDDVLRGGAGDDRLLGGAGDDRLLGGAGGDRLVGGAGLDRLWGQDGADTFVFLAAGHDRVADFAARQDRIDLSDLSDLGGPGGLRLDRGGAFGAGEVRQTLDADGLRVEVNLDGDAAPELVVHLRGLDHRLSADHFDL